MTKDPTYAELAAAYPELDKAGQALVRTVLKETPNSFGMTPVDAFVLLAEALAKAKEKTDQWTQVVTSSSTTCDTIKDTQGRVLNAEPPKTNRRAAIEHTKRKMEDEN